MENIPVFELLTKEVNQKKLLVVAVFINFFASIIFLPIITRTYSASNLAVITTLIFIGIMISVIDVMRPVFISYFSKLESASLHELLVLPFAVSTMLSLTLYMLLPWVIQLNELESIFVLISAFTFFLSTPFLGLADSKGMVGLTTLYRSFAIVLLYVLFVTDISFFDFELRSFPLFVSNVILFLLSVFTVRRYVLFTNRKVGLVFLKNVFHTLTQNFSKIAIDFSDRLFVASMAPAYFISAYNVLYDFGSKSNFFSALYSNFHYPLLCKDLEQIKKFSVVSILVSLLLFIAAIFLYFYGDVFLQLYLGDSFSSYGILLSYLVAISALYSFAFFYQAIYRAVDRYRELTICFAISACSGLSLIYPLFHNFGIKGILTAVIIVKSPGVLLFIRYFRNRYCSKEFLAGFAVIFSILFFIFFLVMSYEKYV